MSDKLTVRVSGWPWGIGGVGVGVWWYVWGIKGFWWGVLYGIGWPIWVGYHLAAGLVALP